MVESAQEILLKLRSTACASVLKAITPFVRWGCRNTGALSGCVEKHQAEVRAACGDDEIYDLQYETAGTSHVVLVSLYAIRSAPRETTMGSQFVATIV